MGLDTVEMTTALSLSGMEPPIVSEAEFQRLPRSIQRKYFSSLERLHIAYSSAHQFNQQPPPFGPAVNLDASPLSPNRFDLALRSPSNPRSDQTTKYHAHSRSRSFAPTTRAHQYLRKPQVSWNDAQSTQAEAHWFHSLPDKVRRQHFTREEQDLLSAHLNPRFLPRHSNRNSAIPPNTPDSSPFVRSSSEEDPVNMNIYTEELRPRRRLSKSAHRNISISRIPPQAFRTSSVGQPPSPMLPHTHRREPSRTGTIISMSRPTVDTNLPMFDPEAVYYRDPEARSKLRQYLGSPQKFDEAVAYGFPSSPPPEDDHDHFRPAATASNSNNDAQTFLRGDSISFIDRYDDVDSECGTSEGETESPVTPADGEEPFRMYNYNRLSLFGGLDSNDLPSLNFKFQPEILRSPDITNPFNNREMTLRMTLTRPDLRANEEDLYGWKSTSSDEDPLALEELPPSNDDPTGAHGAFAIKSNRNSRILFNKILNKVRRH